MSTTLTIKATKAKLAKPSQQPYDWFKHNHKKRSYVPYLENVWLIESFFGVRIDYKYLTDDFVESLFKNADFKFYMNQDKTLLFSQRNELLTHDFGKLSVISALKALRLFGLETLEQVKEKVYIKVKSINA